MDLMVEQDWQMSFATFMANFGRFFKRAESRNSAAHYVRGLLADVKRKSCWQLAEMMGEAHPDRLQHLLYGADWHADAVCQLLRAVVAAQLGYRPGIGVIDESGFVKKGLCSAGVKRQYCGRVGKIENCQVGVYLGYIAPQGHALLDRELYVPQDWCEDTARRAKAKIPDSVTFQTKPQLGASNASARLGRRNPVTVGGWRQRLWECVDPAPGDCGGGSLLCAGNTEISPYPVRERCPGNRGNVR